MAGSSELALRKASEEDLPLLVEIIREAFAPVAEELGLTQEGAPRYPAFQTVETLRRYMREREVRMFLLLVHGSAVGCGGWRGDSECQAGARLVRIAVRPAYQRRGYGGTIVRKLEEEVRKHGLRRASLETSGPFRFYRRLGYRPAEGEQTAVVESSVILMVKDL